MASTQGAFVRRLRRLYGVDVVTRRGWGSTKGWRYAQRLVTHRAKVPADTVVAHVTVTLDPENHRKAFAQAMRDLEDIGWKRFGSGISYNLVIEQDTGMLGIGMPLRAKGTHTVNDKGVAGYSRDQNYWARGIAWIGNVGDRPSDACVDTFVKVLACLMDTGHVTVDPDLDPHSKFAWKECPLESMRVLLPGILRRAQALHEQNKDVRTPRRRLTGRKNR